MTSPIPTAWLTKETSLQKLTKECELLDIPEEVKTAMLAAAHSLLEKMEPGDQLWRYSTPAEAWRNKVGHSGLAIRRGDDVIAYQQVAMN